MRRTAGTRQTKRRPSELAVLFKSKKTTRLRQVDQARPAQRNARRKGDVWTDRMGTGPPPPILGGARDGRLRENLRATTARIHSDPSINMVASKSRGSSTSSSNHDRQDGLQEDEQGAGRGVERRIRGRRCRPRAQQLPDSLGIAGIRLTLLATGGAVVRPLIQHPVAHGAASK